MRWLPVVGYEGIYEISEDGVVKSLGRHRQTGHGFLVEKQIKPTNRCQGYLGMTLRKDGRNRTESVHIMVAAAFLGPRPMGAHVCHNDGNTGNNRADNLRYDTPAANCADKKRHGTLSRGEGRWKAKLTERDIKAIRADKRRQTHIAVDYGVYPPTISRIKSRQAWGHVE